MRKQYIIRIFFSIMISWQIQQDVAASDYKRTTEGKHLILNTTSKHHELSRNNTMNNSLNNSPEKQQLTLNNNVMPKLQKRSALNAALNERVQTPNDTENDTDYGRNASKVLSEDKEETENEGHLHGALFGVVGASIMLAAVMIFGIQKQRERKRLKDAEKKASKEREIPTPSQTVNSPTFAVLSESKKDLSDSETTTSSSSAATVSTSSLSSDEAAKEPTRTDKAGPGQADGGATPVIVVQADSEPVSTM